MATLVTATLKCNDTSSAVQIIAQEIFNQTNDEITDTIFYNERDEFSDHPVDVETAYEQTEEIREKSDSRWFEECEEIARVYLGLAFDDYCELLKPYFNVEKQSDLEAKLTCTCDHPPDKIEEYFDNILDNAYENFEYHDENHDYSSREVWSDIYDTSCSVELDENSFIECLCPYACNFILSTN